MKKWLLPVVLLLSQTAVHAQQTTVEHPAVKSNGVKPALRANVTQPSQAAATQSAHETFTDAYRYLHGVGTSYDPAKAVRIFKQAADRGDGASMNALGNLYVKGNAGLGTDVKTAIDYYKMAGQAGYSTGYYNLAKLYKDDQLLAQDFQQSANYCQSGAAMGDANCKNLLAYYYFKGFGVTQDYTKAFTLFLELAQTGNVNAQYFLGLCYRNGYGTEVNENEARRWLQSASAKGDYQATHELIDEPQPENSNIYNPGIQAQVDRLKDYQERMIASGNNDISGTYGGFAVYYDFSGRYVHEVVSLTLTLQKTNDGYQGSWTEGADKATIKGTFNGGGFVFDPATQYSRSNYYSYEAKERYQFKSAQLAIKYMNDSMYLAGDMQFYSLDRHEPGQPMYILLSKRVEGGGLNGNLALSVSPNPTTSEIKATFTLNDASRVSFSITDMDGRPVESQALEALLPAGTYSIPINVAHLSSGSYALRMVTAFGAAQIKIFIKQ